MQEKIFIQNAKPDDIARVNELLIQLYETIIIHEGLEKEVIYRNLVNACSDNNSTILIAETNNAIIGMIYITYHQSLLHSGKSAYIEELIVHKDFRGQGVGNLLADKSVEIARRKGCSEIEVSTELTNVGAVSFYLKQGFEKIGVLFEKELD